MSVEPLETVSAKEYPGPVFRFASYFRPWISDSDMEHHIELNNVTRRMSHAEEDILESYAPIEIRDVSDVIANELVNYIDIAMGQMGGATLTNSGIIEEVAPGPNILSDKELQDFETSKDGNDQNTTIERPPQGMMFETTPPGSHKKDTGYVENAQYTQ
ncbi:hypothetical protein SNEBB_004366 [Seison nebaliae]|nr:hypothetical protein SNEBB_004366 [Seison nebaliae]